VGTKTVPTVIVMAGGYGGADGGATGRSILELKHHVMNGRLTQTKRILEASKMSLEDCEDEDGNTALHWCAHGLEVELHKREASEEEVMVFLLQHDAPRNRQNSLGESPLFAAIRKASPSELQRAERLVSELLTRGQVDACRADMTGETPLMEACSQGLESIARLLLEHRADPTAKSSSGLTAAQLAEDEPCMLLLKSPLAERAAKEAREAAAEQPPSAGTSQERAEADEVRRKRQARNFEQTLFGQKLNPGLAKDKDKPGKPYPEYGTLHDID